MKRRQLFEWEDQPWLPTVFRDFITDHLHHVMTQGKLFEPLLPLLVRALQHTGASRIVDLCSGGGGPYPELAVLLAQQHRGSLEVVLTDLYPNVQAAERIEATHSGLVRYLTQPTSAFDVPKELAGVRTVFTALHHFPPDAVRNLLADAVRKRQAICAGEMLERSLHDMFKVWLFTILSGYIVTHRVGKLTLPRALLTYVLPLCQFFYCCDGVVSCFRAYSADELRELTQGLASENEYRWEVGEIRASAKLGPYKLTYLLGMPVANGDAHA